MPPAPSSQAALVAFARGTSSSNADRARVSRGLLCSLHEDETRLRGDGERLAEVTRPGRRRGGVCTWSRRRPEPLSALHCTGWDRNQRNGRGQAAPKQTCGAGVTILICPPAPWPEQPQGTVVLCGLLPLCPASLPVTSACHVGNNGLTPGMVGIQNSRSQRARSQALRPSSARPRPRPLLCARLAPA